MRSANSPSRDAIAAEPEPAAAEHCDLDEDDIVARTRAEVCSLMPSTGMTLPANLVVAVLWRDASERPIERR